MKTAHSQPRTNRPKLAIAILAALAGSAHAGASPDSTNMVGEATLVIGMAKLIGTNGAARTIDRGTAIHVGDLIETAAGGHVHLRFVDGARLSVRPSSRLQVENYSRTGDQADLTTIKFRLDEGVVRSITGAWGEAARERFRLNTPVAAIGVKGTDFIVKSDANNTQATVYTGAILLTPLASGCQTSLGPCLNGSEKLLSEDMKGQMLTLSRQQASPQLVPAVDLLAQRARPAQPEAGTRTEAAHADLASEKVVIGEGRAVDIVAVATAQQAALPPQLMWARLGAIASDSDTISRSYAQATEGNRQLTLGNGTYTLYRQASASGPTTLTTSDTSANFRLGGGTAQLVWSVRGVGFTEPAVVNGGSLSVDFARATYATELNISSARAGTDNLASAGTIATDGIMLSNSGNALTVGALSLNGREAAYLFEKTVSTGVLTGITQWGR